MGKARWNTRESRVVNPGAALRRVAMRFCAVLMVFAVAACAPVFRDHGYVPTDQELEQIQVGVDTRETVATLIGRPSAAGLLNDVGWYYVQSRWRHFGARAPQEIARQVVSISFTPTGVVENVERFGLEQGRVVVLSRRVTSSTIKGIGFVRQLLGNLGQLRADSLVN